MTGPEHYREAERLLQPRTVHSIPSGEPRTSPPTTDMILQAQVHATLALAAASAGVVADWVEVCGVRPTGGGSDG